MVQQVRIPSRKSRPCFILIESSVGFYTITGDAELFFWGFPHHCPLTSLCAPLVHVAAVFLTPTFICFLFWNFCSDSNLFPVLSISSLSQSHHAVQQKHQGHRLGHADACRAGHAGFWLRLLTWPTLCGRHGVPFHVGFPNKLWCISVNWALWWESKLHRFFYVQFILHCFKSITCGNQFFTFLM